jgi:predicted RNase H-like HicB family nuclease
MDSVRVICHYAEDGWWAESPDVQGWSAAGESFSEIRALAVEGIPFGLGGDVELAFEDPPA